MKKLIIFTIGLLVLTPFSVGAIQLQTVPDSNPWPTVYYQFGDNEWYGSAGEFQLILGEGNDAFDTVGYCVELEEPISIPGLYDVELEPVTFKANRLDAAWLMNEYAYGLGNGLLGASIDHIMNAKAALQLAIWDTIYGVNFTVLSDTNDSIEGLYADYINGLATAKSTAGGYNTDFVVNFSIAHKDLVQDLLIYNPNDSGAVPEPGTIVLLGVGLIGLVGLGRKKRMKK